MNSAVSHYKQLSIILHSDKIKAEKTLTITPGQKFSRNCNILTNLNTNSLKKVKHLLRHSKKNKEREKSIIVVDIRQLF